MPLYRYVCTRCGQGFDAKASVAARDEMGCECAARAMRIFEPTANIVVPGHFRLDASWCLPDKDDKAAWEGIGSGNGSQTHAPKTESFGDYFTRSVNQFD